MGLADNVIEVFEAQGWPVDTDDVADGMVRTAIQTPRTTFLGAAVVEDAEAQLVFYAVHAEQLPAERQDDVVELVTRANAYLAVGSMEVDLDAGQLRARTSIDMGGADLSAEATTLLVNNAIKAAVVVAYTWFPVVDAVVAGELSVAQAEAQATGR